MSEISELKSELAKNTDALVQLLETAGFWNVKVYDSSIRFGRDEDSNPNSIVLFTDEDHLGVTDFAKNINTDIFGYLMKEKHMTLSEALKLALKAIGKDSLTYVSKVRKPFGGWFSGLTRKKKEQDVPTYSESILDKFAEIPSIRFLKDHISFDAQLKFGLRYDFSNNAIVIPYRSPDGELIGLKCRANRDDAGKMKYFCLVDTAVGQTLYGYNENYAELVSSSTIYVFEAEKSVLQAYSYGVRNCVSIGGHTLTKKQIRLLLELSPKRIVLALDKSLELEYIKENADNILALGKYKEVEIGYLNMENDVLVEAKSSPTDNGEEEFKRIKTEDYERLI